MTEDLRISMIQSHIIWEDREENLGYYGELLRRVSGRTDLAVLPETFTTGFSMDVEKQADTMESQTVPTIKEWAKKYKLAVAGSFIAKDNGKFYNRAFFITPEGEEYYYDKRHLFRMAEEDKHFSAGDKRLIVPYKGWNICLQVCYDLRFPVWSRNVNNEYDLLIYVANWPEARKKAWKALLHARAIENMAYVCGVNRVGVDGKGFLFRGDSMIYNAKGKKLADAGKRCVAEAKVCESIAWVNQFNLTSKHMSDIEFGFGNIELNDTGDDFISMLQFEALSPAQIDEIEEKGYVFPIKYAGRANGTYFSKDRTCSDSDYRTIARNRTIDKSRRAIRNALLPYLNSPVLVNPKTGYLAEIEIKKYQNVVKNILSTMEGNSEISGYSVLVSSNQNILLTDTLKIIYAIVPVGVTSKIIVEEGFALTNA